MAPITVLPLAQYLSWWNVYFQPLVSIPEYLISDSTKILCSMWHGICVVFSSEMLERKVFKFVQNIYLWISVIIQFQVMHRNELSTTLCIMFKKLSTFIEDRYPLAILNSCSAQSSQENNCKYKVEMILDGAKLRSPEDNTAHVKYRL